MIEKEDLKLRQLILWRLKELLYPGEVNNPIYDAYNKVRIKELEIIIKEKNESQNNSASVS